jgi:hypothetical protein
MRPAFIAFIAACLPLGAYAHRGATLPVHEMPDGGTPVSGTAIAIAEPFTATPDLPSADPPLCASPAVTAWNPAAAGDGRVCRPTQWAGVKPDRG